MGILSSTQYLQNKIALLKAFKSLSSRMSPYQSLTLHLSPSPLSISPSLILPLPLNLPLCPLTLSLSIPLSLYRLPSLTHIRLYISHSSFLSHPFAPLSSVTYTFYIRLSLYFFKSFSIPLPSSSWLWCRHLWLPWKPLTGLRLNKFKHCHTI